jgi:hypothetical protein
LLLTVVLVAAIAGAVRLSGVFLAKVTARWSYDYTRDPACTPARLTNCVDHFEVLDISDQNNMKTVVIVPNPSPAAGFVATISVSFAYGPPFGRRSLSVLTVGRDATGNRTTSNPFSSWVTVPIYPGFRIHQSSKSENSIGVRSILVDKSADARSRITSR